MRDMREKTEKTDILIVGAGLVGLSAAIALKQRGFSVRVLERDAPKLTTRPLSLSFGSYHFLKSLQLWDALANDASPILSVHVSEEKKFGFTKFTAKEENVPALGFVVPYTKLLETLLNKNEITIIDQIKQLDHDNSGVKIATAKKNFTAGLLIAADGTYSTCRDFLKIPFEEKDGDDVAEIYQLTLSTPHQHIAYERFTKYGTLAVLPLHDKNKAQLVWTRRKCECECSITSEARAKRACERSKCTPLLKMQSCFDGRLNIQTATKITEYPLKTVIAQSQIAPGAVLVGNAAHTIYPVAAQGFNLGLHDLTILIHVLQSAKKQQRALGDLHLLTQYEKAAQQHQKKIFNLTDNLTRLFDFPGLGCARGFGLLATDIITPLKTRLAKTAMGVATGSPT